MTHIDQVLIKSADFWNENKPTIAGAGLGGLLGAGLGGVFAGVDDDDTLSEAFIKRLKTALAGAALGGITGGGAGYVLDRAGVVDQFKDAIGKLSPKSDGDKTSDKSDAKSYILNKNIDADKAFKLNDNNDGGSTLLTGPQLSKKDKSEFSKYEKKPEEKPGKGIADRVSDGVNYLINSGEEAADYIVDRATNTDTTIPTLSYLGAAGWTGRGAWKGWNTGAYAKNIENLEHNIDRANREFTQLSSYVKDEANRNEQQVNKDKDTKAKLFDQMQKEEVENKKLREQYQREFDDQISNNKKTLDEAQARVNESNKNLEVAKSKKTMAESILTDVNDWYEKNNRDRQIKPTSKDLDNARLGVEQFTKELEHNRKLLAEVQKNTVNPDPAKLQAKLDSILYPYRDQYSKFTPSPIETPVADKYNGRISELEAEMQDQQNKLTKQKKLNGTLKGKTLGAAKGVLNRGPLSFVLAELVSRALDKGFNKAAK